MSGERYEKAYHSMGIMYRTPSFQPFSLGKESAIMVLEMPLPPSLREPEGRRECPRFNLLDEPSFRHSLSQKSKIFASSLREGAEGCIIEIGGAY